jgi:UDP-N-acetylmuramoylalanine--D-glutamate ligase
MYKTNIGLAEFTTTKVGGPASYFMQCSKEKELVNAVKWANAKNIPFMIIGGGSNLLISDDGYPGLVILNRVFGLSQKNKVISAKSGNLLLQLVNFAAKNNLSGMESLAGIPGTIGGAIYGNAGAYGQSASDTLSEVKIFDGQKIIWLSKYDCHFSYRDSIFKKMKVILLEARFKLTPAKAVSEKTKQIIDDRCKKYSAALWCPGSFFKNVEVDKVSPKSLRLISPEKITFSKIPAGYLLESVGAKDSKIGKISVSPAHANFFVNMGGGTADDFYDLAFGLRRRVWDKYGILLFPEVQMVGFDNIFKDKAAAVLGLGLEGKDLKSFLSKEKAIITVFDRSADGENYLKKGLKNFDIIFRSPGVYRYLPDIIEAEKSGVQVSSAIKLFFRLSPAKIIGVTGTKGKGTTSTLIYKIMKKAGKDVYLAGNIGKPYLKLLPKLNVDSWVIMEMSSFQLIDLDMSPHIAVVLNITQDHLDWHKDIREYLEAKRNIVRHQKSTDFAVINEEYQTSKNFAKDINGKVIFFSKNKLESIYKKDLILRGEHNLENIAAAVKVCHILKIDDDVIQGVVSDFKGLEHRLELVKEVNGVTFYNDSFATGPQPTIAAVKSFTEPLTLILGGYDKGLDYGEIIKMFSRTPNLLNIILIGDLAKKLDELLVKFDYPGKIINMGKKRMPEIVSKALAITPKRGVVLLSPAAASFDMFANYKERGELFKKAVNSL